MEGLGPLQGLYRPSRRPEKHSVMGCQLPNSHTLRADRDRRRGLTPRGLTIVEMLVAMSITLLIMAAVVTVFANISSSVTRRRATIEMSSALRNVRETLARDLAGATCPAVPWQRPESNHGYLEIIEGPQNDYYPTPWLWDGPDTDDPSLGPQPDGIGSVPGIDLTISSLPGSNLRAPGVSLDEEGVGLAIGSNAPLRGTNAPPETTNAVTDGRGLGDADDTLMLTVRNETEPFVGRIPRRGNTGNTPSRSGFPVWEDEEAVSPLTEVVWFAVENPVDPNRTFAFGEAGYRTIHRRALLILPDLNYGIPISGGGVTVRSAPGTVWAMPETSVAGGNLERQDVATALAGLIAFQDRYDLSVRLEWDPLLPSNSGAGRWVLRANTLSDLTRRENRYEHHGYAFSPPTLLKPADNPENATTGVSDRYFPFAVASAGIYSSANLNLQFRTDPVSPLVGTQANFDVITAPTNGGSMIVAVEPDDAETAADVLADDRRYAYRPFVRVQSSSDRPATLRAILNEDGQVVHVTRGLAPLGGARRGEDVMMTDALAFDLRVYDPGAPVYGYYTSGTINGGAPTAAADQIVGPGDPSWNFAFGKDASFGPVGDGGVVTNGPTLTSTYPFVYQRQGAYVDLGYRFAYFSVTNGDYDGEGQFLRRSLGAPTAALVTGLTTPRFATSGAILTPANVALTQSYAIYDTWSWHYENNGLNEDNDVSGTRQLTDEGTNGLDEATFYPTDLNNDGTFDPNEGVTETRFGPDDYAERETRPPYDTALRGLQVTLRAYERDSRQIREVKVRESFVPE